MNTRPAAGVVFCLAISLIVGLAWHMAERSFSGETHPIATNTVTITTNYITLTNIITSRTADPLLTQRTVFELGVVHGIVVAQQIRDGSYKFKGSRAMLDDLWAQFASDAAAFDTNGGKMPILDKKAEVYAEPK